MGGTSQRSLSTVLDVHVVVVITVTNALEAPTTAILELLGDLPPVPVLAHPAEARSAIGSVDLKDVEAGAETEGAESQSLPEAHPLDNAPVFVDSLAKLEVKRGIRLHSRRLHEWLELIAGMSWCSFDANDALNGLLTKHGEAKAGSDVRELLIVPPLDLPLVTSIVIVMARRCSVLKSLLEVDLLSLGEPGAGGFSPAVIELKVDVVKMAVSVLGVRNLVVLSRDVALLVEVLGADLGDVHIDHVSVVTIDLHHLVLIITIDVDVVTRAGVLMR